MTIRQLWKATIAIIAVGFQLNIYAQQDALFTQYMFNGSSYNPAYAGSRECLSGTAFYRDQWVGIEGAPKTVSISAHSPLGTKRKTALGVTIENDRIGVINQNRLFADYAYRIPLANGMLSLGIKGGATWYNANYADVSTIDPDINVYGENISRVLPNFGTGVYYYGQRFFAGLAVPRLLNNSIDDNGDTHLSKSSREERHYYLSGGYVQPISSVLLFKPTFLIKYAENAPMESDINLNFLIKSRFWLGASLRNNVSDKFAAVSYNINMMLQATPQIRVGYAYDISGNELRRYSSGSHELMLGYDLVKMEDKIVTPRYF
ncbi:MAG: type IX secretion system membrane protein PorP/SprF [Sphingobacteriales bacterium]|nr:type IX secretion system membrane protein PorP/SprF [Sphingobacteriales bacterium]